MHIAVLSTAMKARSMFVKAVDTKNILDVLLITLEVLYITTIFHRDCYNGNRIFITGATMLRTTKRPLFEGGGV